MSDRKVTAVEWLVEQMSIKHSGAKVYFNANKQFIDQAKEMEKEEHDKFNKFLNDEKELGLSDLKTIERIQWYYNTYFNETYEQ